MTRSFFLLLLAFPVIAGRVAAQGFEGTITMNVTTVFGGRSTDGSIKTATKGDRTVTTLLLASRGGPLAGGVARNIIDRKANTLTTLVPMPPLISAPHSLTGGVDARGLVMVTPLSALADIGGTGSNTHPDIRKLGTSETIAGMSCDDYEITDQKSTPMRACITTALGPFAFPISASGLTGGRGSAPPGWVRAFGEKAGFPLKVWSEDGKVALKVTAIDKRPVADSAFAIPEGYVAMPGRGS
jgi:hypothetical protein